MPISLTCDQFLERLAQNHKLILSAFRHDMKEKRYPVKIEIKDKDSFNLEMGPVLTDIVANILLRAAELIYKED